MANVTEENTPAPIRVRTAVKRCCAAWQRAYDAVIANSKKSADFAEYDAVNAANSAYCNAMPLLVDYEGIRAFMACLSHGILIGTVPLEKCGQLSYSAQVALSTVQCSAKPPRTTRKNAPKTVQNEA